MHSKKCTVQNYKVSKYKDVNNIMCSRRIHDIYTYWHILEQLVVVVIGKYDNIIIYTSLFYI